jgi:uncharacterized membrane protein YeaQ/YmgE (transglycosylase-associated protein family)
MESFIIFILVGLVAGWLAGQIMKGGGFGLIGDIVVGVIGAVIGGWLWGALKLPGHRTLVADQHHRRDRRRVHPAVHPAIDQTLEPQNGVGTKTSRSKDLAASGIDCVARSLDIAEAWVLGRADSVMRSG